MLSRLLLALMTVFIVAGCSPSLKEDDLWKAVRYTDQKR